MPTQGVKISIHVKVISGFYYLIAIGLFLAGVVYCFMPSYLKTSFADQALIQKMTQREFAIYGVTMMIISLLEAILAYKLSKLSKGAKIVALVISVLGFLWALFAIFIYPGFENYLFVALHGYFIGVLMTKYHGK